MIFVKIVTVRIKPKVGFVVMAVKCVYSGVLFSARCVSRGLIRRFGLVSVVPLLFRKCIQLLRGTVVIRYSALCWLWCDYSRGLKFSENILDWTLY